mmetsp:Transcript_39222/g.73145  ORF Transcript_39222/g.73145 Transcript_39222/m.73145 type:complete len:261 (+) Transcript_39222:67-849(+)
MKGLWAVLVLLWVQLALSDPAADAAETAAPAKEEDADLDLEDLENDDDEDDLEAEGLGDGGELEEDFDKDMPEEDRTMRMKICLAGAMARLHSNQEMVGQLAAQLAERGGLSKEQAMNSIFYTWMITCYKNIPDADAKAAASGDSSVLKDAQLYEPPTRASTRQWNLLESVLKEHMQMQQDAMQKQEQQKAQSQSRPSGGQQAPQEAPSPGGGSKLYMLLALGLVFGVIALAIMLLQQKERNERNEREKKKDKKASKKKA